MATQAQIASTYDYMDRIWRLSLGDCSDITAALFDGDYTKSLEQAQRDKHDYIFEQIGFRPGWRVLDIGCGWGAFLRRLRELGGNGVGWTLSETQRNACRRDGLEVQLTDWRTVDLDRWGPFDAIVSVGAFEHFCSIDEYRAGRQDTIYRSFFDLCDRLLTRNGRLFLQTMTWGKRVPDPSRISTDASRESDEYTLALLSEFYPGSWLPAGMEQIGAAAASCFNIVVVKNGRLDYIETITRWNEKLAKFSLRKMLALLTILPKVFVDDRFIYKARSIMRSSNQACFASRLMDHYRIVLHKRP